MKKEKLVKTIQSKKVILKKTIAIMLSASMVAGLSGFGLYMNAKADNENVTEDEEQSLQDQATELFQNLIVTESDAAPAKTETVYVLADPSGNTQKVIVSDWLNNPTQEESISDVSTLTDMENVKDEREFTIDGTNVNWNAAGEDVYYQGYTDAALPISMKVTYFLDGVEVDPASLAGATGHVTMRFDYTNLSGSTATINGQEEQVFVPFTVITGMILDNQNFSNITVTNGKLVNDGTRSIVIGVALPGWQDSLKFDSEDFTLPDYVEVNADVEDFSLLATMSLVTTELLNNVDFSQIQSLNDLQDTLDQLDSSTVELLNGTLSLYENLDTLAGKTNELTAGVQKLADGSSELAGGAQTLSDSLASASAGAEQIGTGLNTLCGSNDSLRNGAASVFNNLLTSAYNQLTAGGISLPSTLSIDNYATVLNNTIAYFQSPQGHEAVLLAVLSNQGITTFSSEEAYNQAVAASMIDAGTDAAIQAGVSGQITNAVTALSTAKGSLDSYKSFYDGVLTYTSGVKTIAENFSTLSSGIDQMKDGSATLVSGLKSLNEGLLSLHSSTIQMSDAIIQLRDGSKELSEGMQQYYDEGISQILESVDIEKLQLYIDRMKAIGELGNSYTNFSGISSDRTGSVKFIFKTDSIGEEE